MNAAKAQDLFLAERTQQHGRPTTHNGSWKRFREGRGCGRRVLRRWSTLRIGGQHEHGATRHSAARAAESVGLWVGVSILIFKHKPVQQRCLPRVSQPGGTQRGVLHRHRGVLRGVSCQRVQHWRVVGPGLLW